MRGRDVDAKLVGERKVEGEEEGGLIAGHYPPKLHRYPHKGPRQTHPCVRSLVPATLRIGGPGFRALRVIIIIIIINAARDTAFTVRGYLRGLVSEGEPPPLLTLLLNDDDVVSVFIQSSALPAFY